MAPEKKSNSAALVQAIPRYPVVKKQSRLNTSIIKSRSATARSRQGTKAARAETDGTVIYFPKQAKPAKTKSRLTAPCVSSVPSICAIYCVRKKAGRTHLATTSPVLISLASVFSPAQFNRLLMAKASRI